MSTLEKLKSIFTGPQDEVNFSELIILATLGKKSGVSGVDPRSNNASDYFNVDAQTLMNFSYEKFSSALKEGAGKTVPLNEEQIKAAFELLINGQAKRDVKATILAQLRAIPRIPRQMLSDIPNIFRNPTDLPRLPGFDVASKTAISIIRPDQQDPERNRVFRLAILAYARINGVNIEEENLTDLCDYLETGTKSDFTKLIENGLEVMKDQYGVTDIKKAAKKFHSISQQSLNLTRKMP
jgi:hypothetical protein